MSAAKYRIIKSSPAYSIKMEKKAEARRERKCFWTWPLGHHYYDNKCVLCGKTQWDYY